MSQHGTRQGRSTPASKATKVVYQNTPSPDKLLVPPKDDE